MKLNNTTGADISDAGITIPANSTYSVDPNNDNTQQIATSETIRGALGSGALTLTIGGLYTPVAPEDALRNMDRVFYGAVNPRVEP